MTSKISRQVKALRALPAEQRVALAKAKMDRVLNHFLYVLELHANNSFIVYSPVLAAQIPRSYAANAFKVFQRGMHQIEIVRLCALWDSVELVRENIPTVIELIDDAAVIQILRDETRSKWPDQRDMQFANEWAALAVPELGTTINNAREVSASDRLKKVMNLRDKHLAHSLEKTHRERGGPIDPVKYGDETHLLNTSIPIIKTLLKWVSGKSFSFENSQKIDHDNAAALWKGCTIKVLR